MAANDTTTTGYQLTREDWLRRAAQEFRGWIMQVSGIAVPDVHVSVGLGSHSYEAGVRGVCYRRIASADGLNHIFVSPELDDTGTVLAVLLHEMIHAALDCEDGHRGRFAEFATRLGLMTPFTTAAPDIATTAQLMAMAATLGHYPHGRLTVRTRKAAPAPQGAPVDVPAGVGTITSAGKPQTNRWIVFGCPTHGDPVRMSRTKAAKGAPLCGADVDGMPCSTRMVER